MSKRIYDSKGRTIWYPGVLEGNCPKCGQPLDNFVDGRHRCKPPPERYIFQRAMSGRRQWNGTPIQRMICSECGKVPGYCPCPQPSTLIKTEDGKIIEREGV